MSVKKFISLSLLLTFLIPGLSWGRISQKYEASAIDRYIPFLKPSLPHLAQSLDDWLSKHPNISGRIHFQMPPGGITLTWRDWDETRKAALRNAYNAYVTWHNQGAVIPFQGTEFPDPVPNALALQDADAAVLAMDEATAWSVYISEIAFTLAGEINHWYGWSILKDDEEDLDDFFSSYQMFLYNGTGDPRYNGYFKTDITPSPPSVVYAFLRDNHFIQPAQMDTIGALVGWMRGAIHYQGIGTALNCEYHWGYRGPPPLSRIFQGTKITDPQYTSMFPNPEHWMQACHGSNDFLKAVLRVVNIPVRRQTVCDHYTPYFPTVGMHLSHGDDPYSGPGRAPPDYLGKDLLIDQATSDSWFPPSDTTFACAHVGRRPYELALQRLPDPLVDCYCRDVAAGKSHNAGEVLSYFLPYYSLADLELAGLWTQLSAKAQAQGKCQ